ncbi:NAD(P)/FAD-dependent oxidoreductase [Pseudoxanthomonas sp. LjRoot125]|uniref:NAD(P)/FAD-dependent oxidoreductase n=1 Tax=Pseudoxanthomonas sp. LjRoot125 TaxID=3342258 RepID=UPI003E11D2E0
MKTPRIVIVGGGIGGMLLATRLGRRLGRSDKAHICLVDREFTHVWKPLLHTIAAGTRDVHQQRVHFLAHAQQNGYHFEPGELIGVARHARYARIGPLRDAAGAIAVGPRELPYDLLVLALGSGANDYGTPGVREHAYFIDSQAQADAFNQALRMQLLRAALHDTDVRIAVVGGGATGVELAAELSDLMEQASGLGDGQMRQRLRLTLYEGGPRILAAFPERISKASTIILHGLGFTIRTGARVQALTEGHVILEQSETQPADLVVWAAGVKAPSVLTQVAGLSVNRLQQVEVMPNLQASMDARIFALGDCASLNPPDTERALPPTAQVAAQQAEHLARHIEDALHGGTVPPFRYRDQGALVSLGKYSAYGTLGAAGLYPGYFIRGRLAQFGHAWLHRRHQVSILGWGRAPLAWLAEATNACAHPPIRLS